MIAVSLLLAGGNGEKHENLQILAIAFLTATATILAGAAIADETAPKEPQAGGDYILVEPPQPMRVAAGKLEIREFFNFSCPHCFRLQGPFSRWRNESDLSDIVIIHQPLSLNGITVTTPAPITQWRHWVWRKNITARCLPPFIATENY